MANGLEKVSSNKAFKGELVKYKFKSSALGGLDAQFNVFIPPGASTSKKAPVLVYLAGLTCTEDTAPQKAAILGPASAHSLALLFPDTSPRGANVPGEDDQWDFGTGAGFYLDATLPAYSKHYRMKTYLMEELPSVIESGGLPLDWSRRSICGHSMGGHGALTLYLSSLGSPSPYLCASAFAPVSNPSNSPWGKKVFKGYLKGGIDEALQAGYDATEKIKSVKERLNILIDYGTQDKYYEQGQLLPENFSNAASSAGHGKGEVEVRAQDGYDHSYFFVSTFVAEHVEYHAKFLRG